MSVPPPCNGTILVVDDEETVLGFAARVLRRQGFTVLTANNGREGVASFRDHVGAIAAVLLDMKMPGMNGEEAFREIQRLRTDVKVLLSSGYAEAEVTNRLTGEGLAGVLEKPYTATALMRKVQEALEK